ncbi:MAG: molecular chaperone DnaK [Myxococcales bacterium]|nr:molecular chaperone DnaK [Myxococcales bacterium]
MADIAIGIDLGTSNSCVARAEDGTVDVLANPYGEKITASVVAFREDGSITVGNSAKANIIHDPENTVSSAKRLIGRYYFSEEVKKARAICAYDIAESEGHGLRINVRNEQFSLPEISAMVLRELKAIAEARLGQSVSKAVITVPAYFNDNQRQATKDAGRIAGLEVLRIINEPTAAALAYGFGKGLKQRVAVYDLGGGTFDISVLEIGEDIFEVLSTCGDTFLGGEDFDDRLIDMLADEFLANTGINLRNDRFALEKLKVASEDAKKALSVDSAVDIRIPDIIEGPEGMLSVEHQLTSVEFGSLVNDLLQRTFKVCDEAVQEAGVVARDLDGVVLVGGPTRLPIIRDAVRAYFQMEPKTDVDPDLAVSMGAAIHASSLVNPKNDTFLLDVTPLSLRIGVAGGIAESVIERNTPVPIEQTRTFTTFKDYQESVSIRIYQGESREAEENEPLGQFEFSGFAKARRGEVEIDVTFEIDTDGIVNVTARDRDTGQKASIRITLSSGLSESEIESIIERANTDRVETTTLEITPPPVSRDPRSELEEALSTPPLSDSQRALEPVSESDPAASAASSTPAHAPDEATPADAVTQPFLGMSPDSDDLLLDEEPAPLLAEPARLSGEPQLAAPEPIVAASPEPFFEEAPTDEMVAYTKNPKAMDLDLEPDPVGLDIDTEVETEDNQVVELTDDLHIANTQTASELHDPEPEAEPQVLEENPHDLFEPAGTDLTTLDEAEDEKG